MSDTSNSFVKDLIKRLVANRREMIKDYREIDNIDEKSSEFPPSLAKILDSKRCVSIPYLYGAMKPDGSYELIPMPKKTP